MFRGGKRKAEKRKKQAKFEVDDRVTYLQEGGGRQDAIVVELHRPGRGTTNDWEYSVKLIHDDGTDVQEDAGSGLTTKEHRRKEADLAVWDEPALAVRDEFDTGMGLPTSWIASAKGDYADSSDAGHKATQDAALRTAPAAGSGRDDGFGVFGPQTPASLTLGRPEWARGAGGSAGFAVPRNECFGRMRLSVSTIMFTDPDHRPKGSWQESYVVLSASDAFEDEESSGGYGEPTLYRTPPCESDDGWVQPPATDLWLDVAQESTTLHLQLWFPNRGTATVRCVAQADLRFKQFCQDPTEGTLSVPFFAVQQQPMAPGSRRARQYAVVPGSTAVGVATIEFKAMVRGATAVALFDSFVQDGGDEDGDLSEEAKAKRAKEAEAAGELQKNDDNAQEKAAAANKKERLEKQQEAVLNPGTYQLIVNVLEVRDLEPSAHACVHVMILDKHEHTAPKRRVASSCSIGETIRVQLDDRNVDEIRDATITLSVKNALLGTALGGIIGEFSIDLMFVYRRQYHEIHEQWVGLSRAPTPSELKKGTGSLAKLRGYLLVSITVLGPGEKPHIQTSEEKAQAKKAVAKVGGGINSLVMMPPAVKQRIIFLEFNVLRAEHLPRLDNFTQASRLLEGTKLGDVLALGSAIQPYVKAYFGGTTVTSKLVVCDGDEGGAISAEFWEKLRLPVIVTERDGQLMAATDTIRIELLDWEPWPGKDTVVGSILLHWKSLQVSRSTFSGARYYPVYGAPIAALDNDLSTNKKAIQLMSQYPEHASQYHGRVLMAVNIDDSAQKATDVIRPSTYKRDQTSMLPVNGDEAGIEAKKQQIFRSLGAPNTIHCTLRAAILCGCDLPPFRDLGAALREKASAVASSALRKFDVLNVTKDIDLDAVNADQTKFFVRIVLGNVREETKVVDPVQGGAFFVVWSQVFQKNILLPDIGRDVEVEICEQPVKFAVEQNSTWVRTTTSLVDDLREGDRVRLYTGDAYFTLHVVKAFPDGFTISRPFPGRTDRGLDGKLLALNVLQKKQQTQLPDLIVQLCFTSVQDVGAALQKPEADVLCYKRYSIVNLMDHGLKMHETLSEGVRWVPLLRDECVGHTDPTKPCGSVLMKVGVGLAEEAAMSSWNKLKDVVVDPSRILPSLRDSGTRDRLMNRTYGLFTLAVHVYMARALPAKDSDGTSDPKLKLVFGHVSYEFDTKTDTLSPNYFETAKLTCFIPIDPDTGEPSMCAPQLSVHFSDVDDFEPDDYMCGVQIGIHDPRVRRIQEYQASSEIPIREGPDRVQWYDLAESSGEKSGRLLMALTLIQRSPRTVQAVRKAQKDAKVQKVVDFKGNLVDLLCTKKMEGQALRSRIHDEPDLLPAMPSLKPKMNQTYKFIEIICLGVRNISRKPPFLVNAPFLEFDLGLDDDRGYAKTDASKDPQPADANFLKRIVMPIELPEEPLFAPELSMILRDREFGGLHNPIIGRATIPLKEKLPWNVRDYKPPQSQQIGAASSFLSGADGGYAVQREIFASDSSEDEFARPDVVGQTLQGWGNIATFHDDLDGTGATRETEDKHGHVLRVGLRVIAKWKSSSGNEKDRLGEVQNINVEENTVDVLFRSVGRSPGAEDDFRTDILADTVEVVHSAYDTEGNLLERNSRVVRRWETTPPISVDSVESYVPQTMWLDALVLEVISSDRVDLLYKRPHHALHNIDGNGESAEKGPYVEINVHVREVTKAQVFDRCDNAIVAGRPVIVDDEGGAEGLSNVTQTVRDVYASDQRIVISAIESSIGMSEDLVVDVAQVEVAVVFDTYGRQLRDGMHVRKHSDRAELQSEVKYVIDEIKFNDSTVYGRSHESAPRETLRADETKAVIDDENSPYNKPVQEARRKMVKRSGAANYEKREMECFAPAASAAASKVDASPAASPAAGGGSSATVAEEDDRGFGLFPADFEIPDPEREEQRAEEVKQLQKSGPTHSGPGVRSGGGGGRNFDSRSPPDVRERAAATAATFSSMDGGGAARGMGGGGASSGGGAIGGGNSTNRGGGGGGGGGGGSGTMSAAAALPGGRPAASAAVASDPLSKLFAAGGAAGGSAQHATHLFDDEDDDMFFRRNETSSDDEWNDETDSVVTPSFSEESEDSDMEPDPPAWMVGRENLEVAGEWEQTENALSAPFESYYLYDGSRKKKKSLFGKKIRSSWRRVGVFKGLIRVMKTKDDPPLFDSLDDILHPKDYTLRVYVVNASEITAPGGKKPSPYLKLQCGPIAGSKKRFISDKRGFHRHQSNPAFYKCYELTATLPGPPLHIQCWHYNDLLPHVKIGESTVDLEERWFNTKWRAEGKQFEISHTTAQRGPVRFRPKALEHRPLEIRSSGITDAGGGETFMSAGTLGMWVEILDDKQADRFPKSDLTPPARKEIEVRVIVWRVKDVPVDSASGRIDLKVACWFSGRENERQVRSERARKRERIERTKRCARRAIYIYIYRCAHLLLLPFPTLASLLFTLLSKETDVHLRADGGLGNFNWRMKFKVKYPWHAEDDHTVDAHTRLQIQVLSMKAPLIFAPLAEVMVSLEAAFRKVMKTGDAVNLFEGRGGDGGKPKQFKSKFKAAPEPAAAVAAHHSDDDVDLEAGDGGESVPLLIRRQTDGGAPPPPPEHVVKSKARQRAEAEEKAAAIQKLRESMGMGATVHPADADWLTLTHAGGGLAETPMVSARILMSVEVMPIAVAEQRINARGRHSPNEFPHLPPPSGRIKFGLSLFNPFYLFRELLGDALCIEITTALTVVLTVVIVLVVLIGGSQLTSAITGTIMFLETNIPAPLNEWLKWAIFVILGLVMMLCCFSVGFCWRISSDSHANQYTDQVQDDYYAKKLEAAASKED